MKRDFNHLTLKPIAHIETGFPEKFGIPRQAGIVKDLVGKIVFEKEFSKDGILKGLDGFSHLILIWGFSKEEEDKWSPTIRPPKLGGNERVGVFASRSPNRPNPLGFSVVKMVSMEQLKNGIQTITVLGADMVSGTPIYDIKPYLAYSDSFPEALSGYAKNPDSIHLQVDIPKQLKSGIPSDVLSSIEKILSQDPRPGYKKEDNFYFECLSYHIGFMVDKDKIIHVFEMTKLNPDNQKDAIKEKIIKKGLKSA